MLFNFRKSPALIPTWATKLLRVLKNFVLYDGTVNTVDTFAFDD